MNIQREEVFSYQMKILILVTKRIQYLIKSKKIIITNSKRRKKKT